MTRVWDRDTIGNVRSIVKRFPVLVPFLLSSGIRRYVCDEPESPWRTVITGDGVRHRQEGMYGRSLFKRESRTFFSFTFSALPGRHAWLLSFFIHEEAVLFFVFCFPWPLSREVMLALFKGERVRY